MHSRLVTARSVSFASTESPTALLTAASSGRPSSTTSAKVARWQRGAWRSVYCWALGASTARCATEMEINLSPSRRRDQILIPQGWAAISAGKQSARSAGDWDMISTRSTRSRCINFPLLIKIFVCTFLEKLFWNCRKTVKTIFFVNPAHLFRYKI